MNQARHNADLIVVGLDSPHLTSLYGIPSHMIYSAKGADVVHSDINGYVVMLNCKLKTLDEEVLLADIISAAGQIQN